MNGEDSAPHKTPQTALSKPACTAPALEAVARAPDKRVQWALSFWQAILFGEKLCKVNIKTLFNSQCRAWGPMELVSLVTIIAKGRALESRISSGKHTLQSLPVLASPTTPRKHFGN